jgi:hypothetical protein
MLEASGKELSPVLEVAARASEDGLTTRRCDTLGRLANAVDGLGPLSYAAMGERRDALVGVPVVGM